MKQMAVFKPSSKLTFENAWSDGQRLKQCMQNQHHSGVQFDLTEVSQCDTAGLALLIEAQRLSQKYHKKLSVLGASSNIVALAEFCGLGNLLDGSHDFA